ncbi:pseudouridine-5'-phosphate glycosidase-like isoform X2 [Bacillus rossius redtenbacheri]|uniref:pseudouridine-5'-phosphate glycosidase-like isoform X2 n=1 Tax=Bacillus rossius redtenbacheri TaxID=93214 RepID=UPI002FDCDB5F
MWGMVNLFVKQFRRPFERRVLSFFKSIDISPEVSLALQNYCPVLALESTIITHGMPYPDNLKMALNVEKLVREQGAVPATVAILGGRIKVGLNESMMAELATMTVPAVKTSRRDFPYVLSKGLNGGTTVSGTILVANMVGIHVFATGGVGGVHRGAENSMDVSADLTELGRNPVTVVSSGVKSILDIGKTLEYLETQGVCVATLGPTRDFPAFYAPRSSHQSPYHVSSVPEAAALANSLLGLGVSSGLLLAVPVPDHCAMAGEEIEAVIQEALSQADRDGVTGKEVTPYLLSAVSALTSGRSLQSNIALMLNNATVGAQVAVELHKLLNSTTDAQADTNKNFGTSRDPCPTSDRLVVLGGSVLDFTISVSEDVFQVGGV